MTTVVDADIQSWYEDNVRNALSSVLFRVLKLSVFEPISGYSQTYRKLTWTYGMWPLDTAKKLTDDAQVDFVGHCGDIKIFPESGTTIQVTPTVSLQLSFANTPDTAPPLSVKYTSPEKTAISPLPPKYVIAEITYGGKTSTASKIRQLEAACGIFCAKASFTTGCAVSVLDVIGLALVVSPQDVWNTVDATILSKDNNLPIYPFVLQLFNAGRVGFLRDRNSLATVVRYTSEQLDGMKTDMDAISTEVANMSLAMATKDDLALMATKHDLASMTTKDDLANVRTDLMEAFHAVSAVPAQITALTTAISNAQVLRFTEEEVREMIEKVKALMKSIEA